jgi:uncharacterized protein YdaU (DUF1376 family)
MHYYKKVIGDYRRRTTGLSLLEHGCYQQLIDEYYLDEKPFPDNIKLLCKKIGARTEEEIECVQDILDLYFKKTSEGWRHNHCDEVIETYHRGAEINKENGKKGGRPKKTHSVNFDNPNESETKGNQEPLTIEPKNQLSSPKFSEDDTKLAQFIWIRILKLNPNHKKPNLEKWADEIRIMREQDKRSHKEMQDVFIYANENQFWSKNILSPSALRKHFDKLQINRTEPVKTTLLKLPASDDSLWGTAKQYGLPDPQHRTYFEYRKLLQAFINEYGILEDGTLTKPPEWFEIPESNNAIEAWAKSHKFPSLPSDVTSFSEYREKILKPAVASRFRYSIK